MSLYEGLAGAVCYWADLLAPDLSHFPGYELPPPLRFPLRRSGSNPASSCDTHPSSGAAVPHGPSSHHHQGAVNGGFGRSASAATLGRSGSGAGANALPRSGSAGAALAGVAAAKGHNVVGGTATAAVRGRYALGATNAAGAGPAPLRNRSSGAILRNGSVPRGVELPAIMRQQSSNGALHNNGADTSSHSGQHGGLSSAGDWVSGASGHSSGRVDHSTRPSSAGVQHTRAASSATGSRSSRGSEGLMVMGPVRGSGGGRSRGSRGGEVAVGKSVQAHSGSRRGSGVGAQGPVSDRPSFTRHGDAATGPSTTK
jgi:hypothetical protein